MNIKDDIQPISYVKAHATELIARINQNHRPIYVTQNGKAAAVIMDPDSFERMQKAISVLKILSLGEDDVKKGRITPQKAVFTEIEKKYGW